MGKFDIIFIYKKYFFRIFKGKKRSFFKKDVLVNFSENDLKDIKNVYEKKKVKGKMLEILLKYSEKKKIKLQEKLNEYKIPKIQKKKKFPNLKNNIPKCPPLKKIKKDFLQKIPDEKNYIKKSIENFLSQINFCEKTKKINLNPENIKLISKKNFLKNENDFFKIIYDNKKLSCPNCKILCKESLKFEKHLDLHYKKEKEKSLKLNKNGNNFISSQKWKNSKFENTKKKNLEKKNKNENEKNNFIKNLVLIKNFDKFKNCEICEEKVKLVWMEDLGKWYFIDAQELVNNEGTFIVHQKCIGIVKRNFEGEEKSKVIKV